MADRSSTIRFKVTGVEQIDSAIKRIESSLRQQQTWSARAEKELQQKVAGGRPEAEIAEASKRVEMAKRSAYGQSVIRQAEIEADERKRATQLREASQRDSIERLFPKATAKDKYEGIIRKQGLEQIKAKEFEVSAQKKLSLDEAAAYKQNEKISSARTQAIRREGLLVTSAKREEVAMQRRLFLDEEAAYAENAKRTAAIAAQKAKALGGAAGTGGVNGAQMQHATLGALVQMGSKRILRQGAGMVAQQVGNVPGIGQEIGLIVGGALYGGPTIGGMALLGGIAAVGAGVAAYYRSANETAKTLSDARLASEKENKAPGEFARDLNKPVSTGLGEKFRQEAQAAKDKAAEIIDDEQRRLDARGSIDRMAADIQTATRASGKSDDVILREWATRRQFKLRINAQRMDKIAKEEDWIASYQRGEDRGVSVASARVSTMHAGSAKQKAELDIEATLAYRAVNREAGEKARAAEQIVNEQEKSTKLKGIAADRAETIAALDKVYGYKEQVLAQNKIESGNAASRVIRDNQITLSSEGFDRERAMIVENNRWKIHEAKKSGDNVPKVKKAGEQALAIQAKKEEEIKGDTLRQLEGQTAVANRSRLASDVEWQERSIALYRQWGAGASADIEKVHVAYLGLVKAQSDTKFADMMQSLGMQAAVARGTKTPFDLIRQGLARDNPNATPRQLDMAAGAQRGAQTAQWLQPQMESLHPLQQFEKYKTEMEEALSHDPKGQEKQKDAYQLLYNKGKQISDSVLGPNAGGQYMDATSYAHSIQSSLIKGDDVTKEQLAEAKKIAAYLLQMIRDGLVVKANP